MFVAHFQSHIFTHLLVLQVKTDIEDVRYIGNFRHSELAKALPLLAKERVHASRLPEILIHIPPLDWYPNVCRCGTPQYIVFLIDQFL